MTDKGRKFPAESDATQARNMTAGVQDAPPRRKMTPGPQEAAARRRMTPGPQEAAPRGQTIDRAIDRAVREMMNVDADPAFRVRVLARLDRPAPRSFGSLRIIVPGAAIAALVLGFVLTRTPPAEPPTTMAVSTQPRESTAPAPLARPADRGEPEANPANQQTLRRPFARNPSSARNITQVVPAGAVVATIADEQPALTTQALDRIAPIAVDPIRPSAIAPAPITIVPLTPIAAIEILPLSPRIERE